MGLLAPLLLQGSCKLFPHACATILIHFDLRRFSMRYFKEGGLSETLFPVSPQKQRCDKIYPGIGFAEVTRGCEAMSRGHVDWRTAEGTP